MRISRCWLAALAVVVAASAQEGLPGTRPLVVAGDPAAQMVEAIHSYLDRESALSREHRATERSAAAKRETLRKIIGAVDPRVAAPALEIGTASAAAPETARGGGYRVYAVRWGVFEGADAEGLLLEPLGAVKARVVAIPDADWTPEMLVGMAPGVPSSAQFARRLAENGCEVLVPVLIDRSDTWSGIPGIRMTNQPHREWIYRMAFETGRTIIGYEVQKVLAAVDWLASKPQPVGLAGYGEGGLLALYAASLDPRIRATLVSGYFQPREQLWNEPIYRDLWGLLRDFGDAELAGMIAPRALVVEASRFPEVAGPPRATRERTGAAPGGTITTPPWDAVRAEVDRARPSFESLHVAGNLQFAASAGGQGPPGTDAALRGLLRALGVQPALRPAGDAPRDLRTKFDAAARLRRQFDQLVAYTQALIRKSERNRADFWSRADASSPERWHQTSRPMRDYIWDEVIGRLPDPSVPADPRTRLIFDEPKFRGYEVMLDVWPGIPAYGILLVPKDIKAGERRPVVVCQHGLEGRSRDVADPKVDSQYYHRFAVRLAEEGFVTFAPQNPYIGADRFRQIQRKGHPLKLSLFSFILGQHQRLLEWLGSLPFVDPGRIGFYGLSYGGKTAVRVPPLLDGYALSICSADFNEWVWKTTSIDSRYSYMLTQEYDMLEFDFANVTNYSDLAKLMAPKPFMVERGLDDTVAPDEWVAYEFAKVRRFYTKMGIPDRTEIEFFNGPHSIHGVGTFAFLRRHLHYPE
ncbi:MAG TPA: dienelactone hydrolase family protein [Bryobacteraceae bacterium]|nr:dienelactone hydrolase family protein [Bryobacteraceae bacterium]